jgi:uncharacterized protein YodC (DUF2158 family)
MEIGDIVQLNSGSPPLTVVGKSTSGNVDMVGVAWMNEQGSVGNLMVPSACVFVVKAHADSQPAKSALN